MKTVNIKCCRDCPYYNGSVPNEPPECKHSGAPKGSYANVVPRSPFEPIPKWCPIRKGFVKIERDSYDKIVSRVLLEITGPVAK